MESSFTWLAACGADARPAHLSAAGVRVDPGLLVQGGTSPSRGGLFVTSVLAEIGLPHPDVGRDEEDREEHHQRDEEDQAGWGQGLGMHHSGERARKVDQKWRHRSSSIFIVHDYIVSYLIVPSILNRGKPWGLPSRR